MMFCSSTFEPDGFNCRTRRIVYYLLPKLHYKQLYIYRYLILCIHRKYYNCYIVKYIGIYFNLHYKYSII